MAEVFTVTPRLRDTIPRNERVRYLKVHGHLRRQREDISAESLVYVTFFANLTRSPMNKLVLLVFAGKKVEERQLTISAPDGN